MAAGVQLSDATRPRVAFARGFHATGAAPCAAAKARPRQVHTQRRAPAVGQEERARFGTPGLRAKRPPACR